MPADKAGVKTHDIFITDGDQKLFSPDQLIGLVRADQAGHEVKLGVVRDGKSQEILVTLGQHDACAIALVHRLHIGETCA